MRSDFPKRIGIIVFLVCGLKLYGAETSSLQGQQDISPCEKAFKARGFHKGYTRFYDEVTNEWLPLAEKLRREEADPEETHIKYFADKFPEHLDFILKQIFGDASVYGNRYDYLQEPNSIKSNQEELEKLFRTKSYQDLTSAGEDDLFKIYVQLKWLYESDSELDEEEFFDEALDEYGNLSFNIEVSEDAKAYYRTASLISRLSLQSRLASISAILLSDDIHPKHMDAVKFKVLLTEYANLVIQNEAVTYKWWLNFNESIKGLLDGRTDMEYFDFDELLSGLNSNRELQALLMRFPHEIVMPSVAGEVGIMALNRIVPKSVYIYGLGTNEDFKTIEDFMDHDEGHIRIIRDTDLRSDPAYNLFHSRWVKAVEELPTEKRKNVEIVYNMLIYEAPERFVNKSPRQLKELLIREMSHILFGEITKIKRLSTSLPKQARQLEKMADDFIELFSQVQTSQAPDTYSYTEEDFARVYNQSNVKDRTYHAEDFIIENGE